MRTPSRSSLLILSRIVAAIFGGYALTYLVAAAASLWLPMPRSEAVLYASAFCFIVYVAVAMYAFAERSVLRLWLALIIASLICGALIWIGKP
jgi:hypothetical protein